HEQALTEYAMEALSEIEGLRVFGPPATRRSGVVSMDLAGVHPHDLATILDRHDVAVRAGHNCTMPLMERLDVPATTRASFYREYILDHYKNPRNFGKIEDADISHEEYNPLCGDLVGMDFRVRDGRIEDVKFHGRGCAISQASASLMTERLKGLSLEEARTISKDEVLDELGIDISPA